jgi:GxxExxY protein
VNGELTTKTAKTTKVALDDVTEDLARVLVDAAIQAHRVLGPGLLKSAYEACLGFELHRRSIPFQTQAPIAIEYDGHRLEVGFRADPIVDQRILVELKPWIASKESTKPSC